MCGKTGDCLFPRCFNKSVSKEIYKLAQSNYKVAQKL